MSEMREIKLKQLDHWLNKPCCPHCHGLEVSMGIVKQGVQWYRCGDCGRRYEAQGNTIGMNRPMLDGEGNVWAGTLGQRLMATEEGV